VATALVTGVTAAAAQVTVGPPEFTGRWSLPFEEGGLETPTCSTGEDGRQVCKPVAQAMSVLPDGRLFYFNGLEGQENVDRGAVGETATEMRDSVSRILDLRSGTPQWSTPSNPTGGSGNPNIAPPDSPADPAKTAPGTAGVPGRAGDGLVGSAWGGAGGPEQSPTAPPNDDQANDGDMFCADVASLPDGRLLIAGGADWYSEPGVAAGGDPVPPVQAGLPEAEGLRSTRILDPRTDTITPVSPMRFNRWYPSLVTLADGKVLVAGGATKRVKNTQGSGVRRTETFDPVAGAWTENNTSTASETSLPLSPRLHLMPNGKVLYTGAGQSLGGFGAAADQALYGLLQFYDPAAGTWEVKGAHTLGPRDGAASVLLPLDPPYDEATVLTFGGTLGSGPGTEAAVPLSTLTHVDKAGNVREELTRWTMLEGRWFPSAVGLPDGTVLSVGGATTSDATLPGTGLAARTVELFDFRTEAWYAMNRIHRDRTYHHSAVLLPDARVLLGGHAPAATLFGGGDIGGPFPNNDRDPSFEIFTPHYLFRGPRPTIRHVQAGIRWGETFSILTRQALTTDSVVLIRLPSPQHIIDSDSRTVRLAFSRGSNRLVVQAPPNGSVAPPGYYYLFLNKQTRRGPIPSMARIVRIGDTSDPSEALQPFPDDPGVPEGAANEDENSGATAPIEDLLDNVAPKVEPASAGPAPPAPVGGTAVAQPGPPQRPEALPAAVRSPRPVSFPLAGFMPVAAVLTGSWLLGAGVSRRRRRAG
jgi:hypothetical protein